MSITLTITSETAQDFMTKFSHVATAFNGTARLAGTEGRNETPTAVGAPKAETVKEPVKTAAKETKSKTTKAESTTVSKTDVAGTENTPVANTSVQSNTSESGITKDDISAAVQSVSSAKDLEVARGIIAQFKKEDGAPCGRISDIQVKDYEDFINTCKASIES